MQARRRALERKKEEEERKKEEEERKKEEEERKTTLGRPGGTGRRQLDAAALGYGVAAVRAVAAGTESGHLA